VSGLICNPALFFEPLPSASRRGGAPITHRHVTKVKTADKKSGCVSNG
jgi:hypothetical protein